MKFNEFGLPVTFGTKMKRIPCKIVGHRWDKKDHYIQPCKNCDKARHRMYSEYKAMSGEKSISWQII